jgi:hypothetical protein
VLLLAGCKGDTPNPDSDPGYETGWFTDTADPENCEALVVTTEPEADVSDWYWRSPPTVFVGKANPDAYRARLETADGTPVATNLTWADNGLSFELVLPVGLEPNTAYVLDVTDCRETQRIPFSTSSLGTPLEGGVEGLIGNTYVIDLTAATWIEPGGFGAILALYFTTPVLIGVEYADAAVIDLMGAQGWETDEGDILQNTQQPSFDFPAANFSAAPFFEADADALVIEFDSVAVPITDFALTGTLSADATVLGGGTITGLGDTRNMGTLLDKPDEPGAICDLAATLGAVCEPCPDGESYCMFMRATNVTGNLVPDVTLSRTE